ncbi:beta-lactamase [Xylariales sp. PMI_506]|nr:beta-lactamase [Xylariales sp. PMI_506]
MAQIGGTCDPEFQGLRDFFEQSVLSGDEHGASIAVNVDGKDVVNLWGGYADAAKTQPWAENTIVCTFSTTKIVTTLAILKLVDSGKLSYTDKVSKYWPEFAANGKEDIDVRQILTHSSGVAGWEKPLTWAEANDMSLSVPLLAAQAPFWPPGTAQAYHCFTYGHLLGEIVRRVSGLTLTEFVAKELAGPAGADVQVGCKEEDWLRTADLIPPPAMPDMPAAPPGSIPAMVFNPIPDPVYANGAEWRKAEIGAANGHGNAHGLVRLFSTVTLAGEGKGPELFKRETAESLFEQQRQGQDLASGLIIRWGNGVGLRGDGETSLDSFLPPGRIGLWGGWGGSVSIMDFDRKVTISYAMSKMSHEMPATTLVKRYMKEIYKGLGVEF